MITTLQLNNGPKLKVHNVNIEFKREVHLSDNDLFVDDYPTTFTAELSSKPNINLDLFLPKPRKLVLQWGTDGQISQWRNVSTKLQVTYCGVQWLIYRRNYKLGRVYFRELVA